MFTRQVAAILTRAQSRGSEAEVTITTGDKDLMGDRIDPAGMDVTTYLSGPASVNYAHDHQNRLPVAKTTALDKSPLGIRAHFRWRDDAFSREVKAAFDDDVLGASVEFIVPEGGAVANQTGGFDFRKTILTGLALTGNPANPRAVKLLKGLRDNLNAMNENTTLDVVDWFGDHHGHGAQFREEEKMRGPVFEIGVGQVETLVKTMFRPAPKKEHHDSPAWQLSRHRRKVTEENDRRWERAKAEGYLRLAAKAEHDIKRSGDFACCGWLPWAG
ncbi:MAG: hypothetical protein O6926_06090 [candidate division NC10 bacterium]|nr:hypothetical protein [candidate division NC10 bacterium]